MFLFFRENLISGFDLVIFLWSLANFFFKTEGYSSKDSSSPHRTSRMKHYAMVMGDTYNSSQVFIVTILLLLLPVFYKILQVSEAKVDEIEKAYWTSRNSFFFFWWVRIDKNLDREPQGVILLFQNVGCVPVFHSFSLLVPCLTYLLNMYTFNINSWLFPRSLRQDHVPMFPCSLIPYWIP